MDLPRFPADLPAPPGVPDGIYSTAEGQYRLAVRDGRVVWTAVILGGDAEDYLAGCASARPMSPAEAEMTIRFALTSHDWGRTWAEAIAQGGEGV